MTDLQVSVEAQKGLERRIKVQVPADRIEMEVDSRLRTVGRTAKLKGFRPGKVPAKVIRQRYGGQVRQEVLQEMVQSSFSEAVTQQNFRPAGGPRIEPENIAAGQDLTFTATFEVYPDVKLKGLDKLAVERPKTVIDDTDLDAMVDTLRKQRATWSVVDRASATGDQITVDFDGTLKGEPIDGGHGEGVKIVLGEGHMLEDFEKNLADLTSGAEKVFKIKFPKDYHENKLAGQKVSFQVTVHEVAEPCLPDLDAEFITSFGVQSGELDDFRQDVRSNMEREVESKVQAEVKRQVMEQLLEANPIELPAVLVDEEMSGLQAESMRRLGITDTTQAPALDSFREAAVQRVRLGLLVAAIIRENDLEVDRERVKLKVDEMCAPYDEPETIRKIYYQNPQLLSQIESIVVEEQVVEWLLSKAKVENKTTGFDELMKG